MPGVSGLPSLADGGSLGLRLNGSPVKAPSMSRGYGDSMSSSSTIESAGPATPSVDDNDRGVQMHKGTSGLYPSHDSGKPSALSPSRPLTTNRRSGNIISHHRGQGQTGSLQIDFASSASATELQPTPSSHLLRPTASMIRKKSGEVVKPSLKQRSMSTPDLTRRSEDAVPDTPETDDNIELVDERSKSVRFAGGDDGDERALESVVLFLREQKVTAVSKAADPERAGLPDTETEGDTDVNEFVNFRTRRNAAAHAADDQEKLAFGENGSKVPRKRVDFAPDARGSLDGELVILEKVELQSNISPLCLRGTVLVRNVSFQKWVAVRFTLDHWQ
jgi:hypothetical protein